MKRSTLLLLGASAKSTVQPLCAGMRNTPAWIWSEWLVTTLDFRRINVYVWKPGVLAIVHITRCFSYDALSRQGSACSTRSRSPAGLQAAAICIA
jgi:hypothetical protein